MSAREIAQAVKWINLLLMFMSLGLGLFCMMLSQYHVGFVALMWISYALAAWTGYTASRFSRVQEILEEMEAEGR